MNPPQRNAEFSLAKLATIFAVAFGIAFGLCSVGLAVGDRSGRIATFLFPLSFIVEAVCLLGLIVVAIVAIIRSVRHKE